MTRAANCHASLVAFGLLNGVLIVGPSGAGKSRLAMALVDAGAQLVADDQVLLTPQAGGLYGRAPRTIAGLVEVRGLGLIRMAHRRMARIALVVDLGQPRGTRLPEPESRTLAGITLPCLPGAFDGAFARAIAHHIAMIGRAETGQ